MDEPNSSRFADTTVAGRMMNRESFTRVDESDDRHYYASDRFVQHLDTTALTVVEDLIGELIVEESPAILDLMAGSDCHLPSTVGSSTVVGLGLNDDELRNNPRLTRFVVHDLNQISRIPFPDGEFHVVLNTVSVKYLTQPLEVFCEVGRVLKPGGLFLVIFSKRFFHPKVVKIWRELSEGERISLVKEYFAAAGGFDEPKVFRAHGLPRPVGDRYSALGLPSDPVYAVYADRSGAHRRPQRPEITTMLDLPSQREALEVRKKEVKKTLCCPYCAEKLEKWTVPQHPFTQWDNEFMYLCFSNECPFYSRSWKTMARQGISGLSYRLMYNPEKDRCMAAPVPSLADKRTSLRG